MVAALARLWAAARQFPAWTRHRGAASLLAAARAASRLRGSAYPAHAEGADLNESAVAPRCCGRNGCNGDEDHSRDRQWTTRSTGAGTDARRTMQGEPGDCLRGLGGELP